MPAGDSILIVDDNDLKSPLLAIRGNGELARRNLEQQRPAIEEVRVHPDALDLREVVAEMVTLLRRLSGENIEVTTAWPDEPVWVGADRSQLEQVVANLAVNAHEATPRGGHLGFEIALRSQQGVLRVSETGIRMDAETASQVFEPFFTSKDEGTGHGLATVHGITTQRGGEITFTTAPEVGTTFEVALPLTNRSPSTPATANPAREQTGAETILLVEDHPAVREVVSTMLDSLGYTVVAATSGDEAVAVAKRLEGNVDLLFTDLMMPGFDGPTTAAPIRELQPRVRVLIMSGYDGESVLQPEEVSPGTAFLQKPFTTDELALALRRLDSD